MKYSYIIKILTFTLCLFLVLFPGCVKTPTDPDPVKEIPLSGPVSKARAEISGLAWCGDRLILLPQYPERFGPGQGRLFSISRPEIEKSIKGSEPPPVTPAEIRFIAPGIAEAVPGYDGYEAIAFYGKRVYLAIESNTGSHGGYLVRGIVSPGCDSVHVDRESMVKIPGQSGVPNASYETLVIAGKEVVAIHEACGRNVNARPVAHVFDLDLRYLRAVPFPNVEYRITDAAAPDSRGRFRAINYFWKGDMRDYKPEPGPHARNSNDVVSSVERLVLFRYTGRSVEIMKEAPLYIHSTSGAGESRNWEGIAALDELGFLLVTDRFPRTILGFVRIN